MLRGVDRTAAIVAAVFVAGALVRLAFMFGYAPAFLGIPDSGSYINSADHGLFADVYHPAGYPLFVRVLHGLYPHLGLLTFVQHLLGLATAALWYAAVRRITGGRLLGLIPAAVVLFDGFGLWIEHAPLSDPLFGFLVAGAVYGAVRASRGPWWGLALVAAGIVAAGTVRPVGFALALPIAVWLVFAQSSEGSRRFLPGAAVFVAVIAGAFGYALVQGSETGVTQLTVSWGRLVYARAAQFADCSQFTPPAGTRRLCEQRPTGSRGSVNQYLTGAPDKARTAPGDRSISPAWRVFGPPPAGNSELAAFGRTAILHQPLDYVGAVARDFHYFWVDDHARFIDAAGRLDPNVLAAVSAYYADTAVDADVPGALSWYGRQIDLRGILVIALLVASIAAIPCCRGARERRDVALLAAVGWLLPLASVATAGADPRYLLPAYGPLVAASAIGLRHAPERLRAARGPRAPFGDSSGP